MTNLKYLVYLIPVLVAVLANMRIRTEWIAMTATGAFIAILYAIPIGAVLGPRVVVAAAPVLLYVFGMGCLVGGVVAIPFKIWRQRRKKDPPASGPAAQPNNALEQAGKDRERPTGFVVNIPTA